MNVGGAGCIARLQDGFAHRRLTLKEYTTTIETKVAPLVILLLK